MSNKVFYSADYSNENFTGLFDRIINIKFTRANGETFTLRSDYEPVWEGNLLYFKTCQPKPAIRVQYTQYQATMINVDIFITNLNIIEYKGNKAQASSSFKGLVNKSGITTNQPNDLLSRLGNPITKAEIEMGYRGDFYNWSKERPTLLTQEQLYKSFLNLEVPSILADRKQLIASQSLFKAQRRCSVTVEWTTNTNNPPDRITQFHGYVGSTEAGFQPYAGMVFDNTPVGEAGQVTKTDILEGLNDSYANIDVVETSDLDVVKEKSKVRSKKKKAGAQTAKKIVSVPRTTYRNFFNGGKPFRLLEGYCFHTITRRFVRQSIDAKRNSLLEQAALEYALASEFPNAKEQLSEKREEIAQRVYRSEQRLNPESFTEENGVIEYSTLVDSSYKQTLEKLIDDNLIETFIGARYTVKNLPEQRKLYNSIRKVLTIEAAKEKYMAWWDAAEQLSNYSLKEDLLPTVDVEVENTIQAVRQYLLDAENGKYKDQSCYIKTVLSKDWILPVQNTETDRILKDNKQQEIYFYPPTKVSATGFAPTDKSVKKRLRCFSGLFEVRDAYLFGVPVLCSDKACEIFDKQQAGKSYVDFMFLQNPQTQVEWICKTWNLLYYTLHNGGFYIYEPSEKSRETSGQSFVQAQSQAPFKIPAIYDITLSPVRKIRMPFIAFLNPMQLVEWNSTAAIGEMISFYYQPNKGRNFFMVIKNVIDFSTVEDFNTMEIDLVDTQYTDRQEVPGTVLKQDNKGIYIEVLIIPDSQTDTWQKIYEGPMGSIPVEMLSNWTKTENIDTNVTDGNKVPPLSFFNLMKAWNPSLFMMSTEAAGGWSFIDGYRRVDKNANKRYGNSRSDLKVNFPDLNYCLPLVADATMRRIFMKFPFMPSETDYTNEYDKAYILVYENGVWEMKLKELVKTKYQIGAL